MDDFYVSTLRKLTRKRILDPSDRVLVVCGGEGDCESLQLSGFKNVTISNLDDRFDEQQFEPYQWSYQDAEDLTYGDDEFDFCIAHSGLHHCRSPHRGLLEMYRVARKGVLVYEPIDNMITRLGVKFGLGEQYEIGSVAGHGCQMGGVRNSSIPNYIYRWTEREIEKAVNSYAPLGRHQFHYFYQTRINWARAHAAKSSFLRIAYTVLGPLVMLAGRLLPRESNNFAFCVEKPDLKTELHPWLEQSEGRIDVNRQWIAERFHCEPLTQA